MPFDQTILLNSLQNWLKLLLDLLKSIIPGENYQLSKKLLNNCLEMYNLLLFWKAGDDNAIRNLIVVYFKLSSSCFLFGKQCLNLLFWRWLQAFSSNVYYQEFFGGGWLPQIKYGNITLTSVKSFGMLAEKNRINQKSKNLHMW